MLKLKLPILWPPDAKSWLIWKYPDAGKDWGQEEKGKTEDEMVRWHHRLNGHGFGTSWWWTRRPGVLRWVHGVAKSRHDWATELNWALHPSLHLPFEARDWVSPPFQCWDYVLSFLLEQKLDPMGQQTCSAHPARFSPDDKYSRHRITIKKRFKVLMTQQPRPVLWGCLNISCVFCCLPAPSDCLQPGSSVCEPGTLLRLWPLESGLIFAFDHACCEAVMVASPSQGRYLNLFVQWITASLLKWFQRAVILYIVGKMEWFKNKNKGGEREEYPRGTTRPLGRETQVTAVAAVLCCES